MRTVPLLLLVQIAASLPGQDGTAAGAGGWREEVHAFLAAGRAPGLVVGSLDGERCEVHGFGHRAPDDRRPADGRTVYEIGSITKVFTGILLADAVARGELTLETPLAETLPSHVEPPTAEKEPIRLVHLATHTSGLPRIPPLPEGARDPYAGLTPTALYEFLADLTLTHAPGRRYRYSNLGHGLLGHAVARKQETTWKELVVTRLCRPLGLDDTRPDTTGGMAGRLAPPHGGDGRPRPGWTFPDCMAGCGALRSTADDLLRFAAANLAAWEGEDDEAPLTAALRAARPRHHAFDAGNGVALGWHVDGGGTLWWHNGGTGGYRSHLVLEPGRDRAVVVLANTDDRTVDGLARTVLRTPD